MGNDLSKFSPKDINKKTATGSQPFAGCGSLASYTAYLYLPTYSPTYLLPTACRISGVVEYESDTKLIFGRNERGAQSTVVSPVIDDAREISKASASRNVK